MRVEEAAHLAVRHIRNAAAEELYLATGADVTRPVSVYGIVNERCNYRCQYCEFWRMKAYKDEMSAAQWSAALDSLRDFLGRFHVEFSGGEPYIKAGFLDIIGHCAEAGIDWGVTTNGSAFSSDKVIARTVAACPMNVNISIDGDTPELHDAARGVPGSLERLKRDIPRLLAARDAAGGTFALVIKPVVHKLNFRRLPEIVRFAKSLGATAVNFQPVDRWTPETYGPLWLDEADLAELDGVVEELLAMKREGWAILNSELTLRHWGLHFRGGKAPAEAMPCRVGMRNYFIRPDGEVEMCWSFPSIGNVKTASARDIWYGPKAREVRAGTVSCEKLCLFTCLSQKTLKDKARMAADLLTGGRA